jgi:hypothetical protein
MARGNQVGKSGFFTHKYGEQFRYDIFGNG